MAFPKFPKLAFLFVFSGSQAKAFARSIAHTKGRYGAGYANNPLAIDQGPIIEMIENYRTGLLWKQFMQHPDLRRGLKDPDSVHQ